MGVGAEEWEEGETMEAVSTNTLENLAVMEVRDKGLEASSMLLS